MNGHQSKAEREEAVALHILTFCKEALQASERTGSLSPVIESLGSVTLAWRCFISTLEPFGGVFHMTANPRSASERLRRALDAGTSIATGPPKILAIHGQ